MIPCFCHISMMVYIYRFHAIFCKIIKISLILLGMVSYLRPTVLKLFCPVIAEWNLYHSKDIDIAEMVIYICGNQIFAFVKRLIIYIERICY